MAKRKARFPALLSTGDKNTVRRLRHSIVPGGVAHFRVAGSNRNLLRHRMVDLSVLINQAYGRAFTVVARVGPLLRIEVIADEFFELALNLGFDFLYFGIRCPCSAGIDAQGQWMDANIVGDTFQLVECRALQAPLQHTQLRPAGCCHRFLGYDLMRRIRQRTSNSHASIRHHILPAARRTLRP